MINEVGKIMLYVDDQDKVVKFWIEKVGFHLIAEENRDGMHWIEVAPTKAAETSLVLHDKKTVAEMSPELNLGTPSLMFHSDNLDQLRKNFMDKGITVGDLMQMPSGKVFNFADDEENYFAVMEK